MKLRDGLYRRNGKKVYIKQPEYNELEFVKELWSHKQTMKDIGGVFYFTEEKWDMFYKKMVNPTDGKNFYCLVYDNNDDPVGEVSFHGYDSATKIARFNVKIHYDYRNNGYGEEAVRLLLEYYFTEFGGDMLMDKISTIEGERVAQKLGFEEVRKFGNNTTVRINKSDFLNFDKSKNTNIGILMIENMNMLDYSMAEDLFLKANRIIGRNMFNVFGIEVDNNINISKNIKLHISENNIKPNILIIPGGNKIINENNKEKIISYILKYYKECDFICAMNEGIYYLANCKELKGVLVPYGDWIEGLDIEKNEFRLVKRNYTDNGKIMLSTNIMGNLELYLNLIKKIGGNDLEEKLASNIGLKNK